MTKANLKAALDALQVKNPLKLQAKAPFFTPPTPVSDLTTPVENRTRVEKETQVPKQTQVENPTMVGNATQVPFPTQVSNPTEVRNSTQVSNLTWVGNATQVENATQAQNPTPVGNTIPVPNSTMVDNATLAGNPTKVPGAPDNEKDSATLTRRATEQDSSVVMAARAADGLERGYTRIPNEVLMKLARGDFTRNEIKLALLIARFTISFQRRLAPLSKAVLERHSRLRGPAVLEALSGLVAKGLVEKQQGDQHRPNQLGLILPDGWDLVKKKDDESLVGISTPVENRTQVGNPTGTLVGKTTPAEVGNPTHFKDIKIYKNSLSDLPEPLQKYFSNLKPAKKRESEWGAFESLNQEYSPEDISACLLTLQEQGIKRGESLVQCHSPMAYLAKAIDPILAEIEARRKAAKDRQAGEEQEIARNRAEKELEAQQAAEWAVKEKAFLEAIPARTEQLNRLTELLAGSPFSADSRPGWILGIGKWWEEQRRECNLIEDRGTSKKSASF